VVFVDLKGFSHEVLSVMQRAARAREAKTKTPVLVKYFTLAEGEASYLLDIFSQAWWKRLAVPQRAGVILSTLGLRYSAAYGESWFRDVSYEFISVVLDRHPNVASWTDLWRKMVETRQNAPEHVISKMCREKGGEHIGIIVKRIASLAALNNEPHLPQSVRDNAIDFSSGHSYFSLCSLDNGLIAGEVGRLVAAAVLGSARALPSKRKKTVLVLDEWQEMITGDLEILLSQARSLGVAVILANQNAAQLVTKDKDMRPIVEGNCACQLFLGTLDIVGREQLQKLGGKEIDWLTTQQWPAQGEVRYSFVETVQDRVSNNLISEVASDESKFFVRLADNVGYACYGDLLFVGETMHHQTKKLYDDACEMPWPGLSAVTLQNANAVPRFRQNPRQAVSIAAQPRRNGNPVSQPTSP
jgi:hypothetical protein